MTAAFVKLKVLKPKNIFPLRVRRYETSINQNLTVYLNSIWVRILIFLATCIYIQTERKLQSLKGHAVVCNCLPISHQKTKGFQKDLDLASNMLLLKSDVTTRDHVVCCRGSQECGSRNVNFACKFHRRSHRVRITLKSTTLFFMRSRNVWTTKPWLRSEWPLDFNSVLSLTLIQVFLGSES